VNHVADVVQQGGDDQGVALALLLGQRGGLQRVLLLVDQGEAIAAAGLLFEQVADLGEDVGGLAYGVVFSK